MKDSGVCRNARFSCTAIQGDANQDTVTAEDGKLTLSDISKLIDAVYISKTPPAAGM